MSKQSNPDSFGELKFTIPLQVSVISTGIAVLVTVVFFLISTAGNPRRQYQIVLTEALPATMSFFLNALIASAAGTSSYYAFKSIENSERCQRVNRTFSYIDRWNDPGYFSMRNTAAEIHDLISHEEPHARGKRLMDLLSDSSKRQDITNILNFLEEMSIGVQENLLDEELLKEFYKGIVITYCKTFSFYIAQRRTITGNDNVYRKLTNLSDKWRG